MNDVDPRDLTAPVELSKGWFEFIKICEKKIQRNQTKKDVNVLITQLIDELMHDLDSL